MAGNRRTYDAAIRRAAGLVREHRWSTAIEAYNEALAEYPQDVAALTGLGLAYAQIGQSDKALSAYRQAADRSSDNPEVIVRLARTLEHLARWPEAADAYVRAAQACVRLHDTPQAIELWHKAAMLDPQCLTAHQGLAQAYVSQGDTRKAARHHLIVARVHNRQGHLSKAVEQCKAALELDPHNPEAHAILAALTRRPIPMGSGARELPDGPTARLQPDAEGKRTLDSFVVFEDIELESMSRAYATVYTTSSDASRSSPADIVRERTVAQMAEALFLDDAQPQPTGAATPLQWNMLLAQGADFQTRGLVDRAIEAYSSALAAVSGRGLGRPGAQAGLPLVPAVHLNLGLLYCENGQFERAVEHLSRVLSEPDLELGARFALGQCYLAWGRAEEAVRHLLETLRLIDSHTVLESQVEELDAAYARIVESAARQGDASTAAALAQSVISFLSSAGWRERILQVRKQLNALASDGILITLAEMVVETQSGAQAETVATAICQIQEYLDQSMFFTALEECYWAIQQAPYFLPLHLLMADVLIAKGQLAGAVSKYIITAGTYQVRGDVQRAIAIYSRALQIAPMNIEVREKLVELLVQAGMIDRAMEEYIAAADSYYQLAQIDRAIETLDGALTYAGQGDPARHWQSNILHRIGDINTQRLDWPEAIRIYSRIKRIDPQDAKARLCLVDLYFKLRQRDAALGELDELIDVYRTRRQPQALLDLLRDAVQARPDELGLRMRLAKLYLDLRRTEEAIAELDAIGELQLKLGMPQEAIRTIQAIIRLGPKNVEGYRQLLAQLRGR